jgi:hypothetical protein
LRTPGWVFQKPEIRDGGIDLVQLHTPELGHLGGACSRRGRIGQQGGTRETVEGRESRQPPLHSDRALDLQEHAVGHPVRLDVRGSKPPVQERPENDVDLGVVDDEPELLHRVLHLEPKA